MKNAEIMDFYKEKRVFITGHTGFKGAWLTKILNMAGAEITGYSLSAPTKLSLYELLKFNSVNSVIGDIRDFDMLKKAFDKARPEIVFHLAAKSIVRYGYINPRETYETNSMGTVNILECMRLSDRVKSFLNVTTDKVYENKDKSYSFREDEPLNGDDPYSNSKSCSELITQSYRKSFFSDNSIAISTARAGNAIGGGDFADYRIIPDCVRAAIQNTPVIIRNPKSVRPYQHVLEPLFAYMLIAKEQYENKTLEGSYNIGPEEPDYICTEKLAQMFSDNWGGIEQKNIIQKDAPQEAERLKIDCSKIKSALGWKPKYSIETAVKKTVDWTKAYLAGDDINALTEQQINDYLFS